MATKQTAPKAETPAAVKAAATRTHRVKAGTIEGPKGKKLVAPKESTEVTEEQRQAERRQQTDNQVAQFAASAMTTPAVHDQPSDDAEAIKTKAFQEAVQALANSMGVDPAAVLSTQGKAKTVRADRLQQNNITRPASGTTTGKIWDLADKLSAERGDGHPVEVAKLRAHADMKQVNDHTLKTQFARWRSFHGIKGRTPALASPEQPNRRADDPKPE